MGFRDEPKNSLTVSVDLLLISFNLISHWPEEEGKEKRIYERVVITLDCSNWSSRRSSCQIWHHAVTSLNGESPAKTGNGKTVVTSLRDLNIFTSSVRIRRQHCSRRFANFLRTVPAVGRWSECNTGVRVQNVTVQRASALHGQPTRKRVHVAEAGRGKRPAEVQLGRRGPGVDGQVRYAERVVGQ